MCHNVTRCQHLGVGWRNINEPPNCIDVYTNYVHIEYRCVLTARKYSFVTIISLHTDEYFRTANICKSKVKHHHLRSLTNSSQGGRGVRSKETLSFFFFVNFFNYKHVIFLGMRKILGSFVTRKFLI